VILRFLRIILKRSATDYFEEDRLFCREGIEGALGDDGKRSVSLNMKYPEWVSAVMELTGVRTWTSATSHNIPQILPDCRERYYLLQKNAYTEMSVTI
jgi:hypothetical protein